MLSILKFFSESPSTPTTTMTLDERVERAKRLLAEKQAQKVKEDDDVSYNYFYGYQFHENFFFFFFL